MSNTHYVLRPVHFNPLFAQFKQINSFLIVGVLQFISQEKCLYIIFKIV